MSIDRIMSQIYSRASKVGLDIPARLGSALRRHAEVQFRSVVVDNVDAAVDRVLNSYLEAVQSDPSSTLSLEDQRRRRRYQSSLAVPDRGHLTESDQRRRNAYR
jgi:hypothetical protein